MKKLTLLLIALAMLVCLFACEKPKNNDDIENTDVSEQSEINGETANDIQDDNSIQHLGQPEGYYSEFLYTKAELIKWLNGKQYMQAKNEKLSEKFISIYNEILSGKKNLYLAYKNGKEIETTRYICSMSNGIPEFTVTLKDDLAKDGYVQINMQFINDEMRGETDPWLVFRNFWPGAKDLTKNKKDVKVMGKEIELLYHSSDYIYYYNFVYEDVFVSVMMYDKNDSIDEFLDGFELRPLVLTDEKIPA